MTSQSKKKVLVIEDERDLNNLYVKLLRDNGYDAEGELSGKEGLLKIEQNGYDLILLDLLLPDIHGIEILKKINNLKNKYPVVALTNYDKKEVVEEAMKHGVKAYIKKVNLNPQEFIEEINKIFDFFKFDQKFS